MINEVIALSFVTASVAFAVTETKLFGPARERIIRLSAFLGEHLSCGYCFGHSVAFILVAVYRPKLFDVWLPLDYFLTALAIAWLSAFQWALMCLFMIRTGK